MENEDNFYVVGIGLSAGGLDPLRELLANLPPEPGAAFVVVSHMQANQESRLDTILAKSTALPVEWMTQDAPLLPNRVYLLPPGKMATLQGIRFRLRDRLPEEKINRSVTIFFSAMAEHLGNRSIGVILSGNGSDGLEGVRAIEDQGGIVMVQHPATARFNSMPGTVVNQDHPDVVLPPVQLAQALMTHLRVPPYSFGQRQV
jgi:two-component system CheB/CheR fusion protein